MQGKEKEMRVRPILFNTDMVQAILDGRKTVTRRVVKKPYFVDDNGYCVVTMRTAPRSSNLYYQIGSMPYQENPYKIGDILYVRETWSTQQLNECMGNTKAGCPYDSCETAPGPCFEKEYIYKASDKLTSSAEKWHPSIHMPKEAARIWLKVKDVRVERLQDITEEQAKSEGAIDNRGFIQSPENEYNVVHSAKEHFMSIWNSTISKGQQDLYSWGANPWTWVIEFERCEKPEAAGEEE